MTKNETEFFNLAKKIIGDLRSLQNLFYTETEENIKYSEEKLALIGKDMQKLKRELEKVKNQLDK